jgi:hypothetical protein
VQTDLDVEHGDLVADVPGDGETAIVRGESDVFGAAKFRNRPTDLWRGRVFNFGHNGGYSGSLPQGLRDQVEMLKEQSGIEEILRRRGIR